MGKRSITSDTERVAKWARKLVEDLGPDLRQCLRWMHDGDPEGLTIVLASMRRCGVPEIIQQGTSLYWRRIGAEKRGKVIVV